MWSQTLRLTICSLDAAEPNPLEYASTVIQVARVLTFSPDMYLFQLIRIFHRKMASRPDSESAISV